MVGGLDMTPIERVLPADTAYNHSEDVDFQVGIDPTSHAGPGIPPADACKGVVHVLRHVHMAVGVLRVYHYWGIPERVPLASVTPV